MNEVTQEMSQLRSKLSRGTDKRNVQQNDEKELHPRDHLLTSNKNIVGSRYLEVQGTLWNTSRYSYFDMSDV